MLEKISKKFYCKKKMLTIFFSSDFNEKKFGYVSHDFKKKNSSKKKICWHFAEMPLSANLFRLEPSILTPAKRATSRINVATEKRS